MKRQQRGRSRGKPSSNQGNRSFESNGPDVKIRGNAAVIHEKYMQLARDASSSGDRVMAENYYQYADHYFRVVAEQQAVLIEQQQRRNRQQQNNPHNQSDGGNDRRPNYRNRNDAGNNPTNSPNANGSDQPQPQPQSPPQPRAEDESDNNQPEAEAPRRGRRPRRQPVEDKHDPLEVVDPEAGQKTEIAKSGDDEEQPKPRRGRRPRKTVEVEDSGDKSGDGSETEAA